MTKAEFKKKWAPKVKSSTGICIVTGWEEDLESMIQSEKVEAVTLLKNAGPMWKEDSDRWEDWYNRVSKLIAESA